MNMETKVRCYAMPNIASKGTSEENVFGRFTVITAAIASRDRIKTPRGLFVIGVDERSKSAPNEEGDFGRDEFIPEDVGNITLWTTRTNNLSSAGNRKAPIRS